MESQASSAGKNRKMQPTEKRRFVRVRPRGLVAGRGAVVVDPRKPAIECVVIDLSAGGAQVDVHGQTAIPERVTFIHSGTRKSCRVVWRRGRRVGLQF
jgi:hypothetical protein